jgi:hypothetical protein
VYSNAPSATSSAAPRAGDALAGAPVSSRSRRSSRKRLRDCMIGPGVKPAIRM